MAYSFNGNKIKTMELTKSWGLSPASASLTVMGTSTIASGSEATLNLGSTVFSGVVTQSELVEQDGRVVSVNLVDDRIKLMWDDVYGYFNGVEVIEDDPKTQGIDRKKRFWHVYPDDWEKQKKTYTDKPHTARQICEKLLQSNTVRVSWTFSYHSRFSRPVFGVDAMRGAKLGNVLQTICDALSLMITVSGRNSLKFAVKGEGTAPTTPTKAGDRSKGEALGADTFVRVVGDRNRYQDLPITLEPDWNTKYEKFWFTPVWVAEVRSVFGLTDADQETVEARAREVTVREYAAKKGDTRGYGDRGIWGEVSRMEIPVWAYITDIVFKAYRIPRSYTIEGAGLDSLELREGLLAAVDWDASNGNLKYVNPTDAYPDAKAFVIVKGAALNMLNPAQKEGIQTELLKGEAWVASNEFRLDTRNKTILFEHAVIETQNLFLRPNTNANQDDPGPDVIVPNAAATIKAAQVRASLCFEGNRFFKEYGSGKRKTPFYVEGLNRDILMTNNIISRELRFADDETADQKASEAGKAFLEASPILESGGFTRYGVSGMDLNGTIDRVTTMLRFEDGGEGEGLSERVDYAKERVAGVFESERELERRQRSKDLFPGQSELKEAVKQFRIISKLTKDAKRDLEKGYANLDAVTRTVVGNVASSSRTVDVTEAENATDEKLPVGAPVFEEGAFLGIVTAANVQEKHLHPVATQGIVPVRVQGPVTVNATLFAQIDSDLATTSQGSQSVAIGTAMVAYTESETKLIPARLAGSGGGGASCTNWRPSIKKKKSPAVGWELTVEPGKIDELVPANMFQVFTVPETGDRFLVAKCATDGKRINTITLELRTSAPASPGAVKGGAPLTFDVLITWVKDHKAYKMVPCFFTYEVREVLRSDKASPTPGTLPYESWYTWKVKL